MLQLGLLRSVASEAKLHGIVIVRPRAVFGMKEALHHSWSLVYQPGMQGCLADGTSWQREVSWQQPPWRPGISSELILISC